MRRLVFISFGLLLALCAANAAAEQLRPGFRSAPARQAPHRLIEYREPPGTATELLRRALEARGGEAAAAAIQSFRAKGFVDVAGGGRGEIEIVAARPNQLLIKSGGAWLWAFDGQTAWEAGPGIAPEPLSGARLHEARDEGAFFAWLDDPRNYRSITFAGETSFDGARCYELKLVTQSGLERTHYYSATNCLLTATVCRLTSPAAAGPSTAFFQDYREYGGFWFPARIRCRTPDAEYLIMVDSFRTNCVDPATFRMPAKPSVPFQRPAALSDADIKTMLQDCIDADKLAVGLVVAMVDPQGSRVISWGKTDNGASPEVNGDTLFEIGSITKVFTHLLLHDMVARGEMKMDDPVQRYLPASVRMPVRDGKAITLWHLTTHTSGLPRDIDDPHDVEHLYAFLNQHQLARDPGQQFEYSNIGVALLGHLIALKTGQDYETLVRERICRPLKMDSTAISLTPELKARQAVGHAPANRPAGYIGLQKLPGAGALFSTANDMLKLASAKLGLTTNVISVPIQRAVGHGGGTFGFCSVLTFDVRERRALVMLSNCRQDDLSNHLGTLLKNRSPRPAGAASLSADAWERCVGQYYARANRLRTIRREGNRLLLQEQGKPSFELFAQSPTNFVNALFDCSASFAFDPAGRANELILGDPAHPSWRGARLPGPVLPASAAPLTEAECRPREGSDLQGVWKTTLRAWYWPFYAAHVTIRIAEPVAGAFRASLDCPELEAKDFPLGVIYNAPTIEAVAFSPEGYFQGKLNPARTKVTGRWKQAGHTVRATLRRVASPAPSRGASRQ